MATEIGYAVPSTSLDFWKARFAAHQVNVTGTGTPVWRNVHIVQRSRWSAAYADRSQTTRCPYAVADTRGTSSGGYTRFS